MGDEALQSKLNGMATEFKNKSDQMLKEMISHFDASVDAAIKNFVTLQASYLQGYEEIFKQTKKANEDMLKNLEDNMKNLKLGLQSNNDSITTTMNEGFEKAISQFKTQGEETLKKFPTLPTNTLKDAVTFLSNHHKQVLEANGKRYKGILEQLDKRFRALAEEVTIPTQAAPKLIQPVWKGGVGVAVGAKDDAGPSNKGQKK